ncbi:DUF1972 domain-containing protein [Photobacterium sp. CAU 1568]|uniref:DUF1972 domain-containing protein n=1 Tax=Photobacterium arenosum TaxID=2774143 RepID=A0ABR9BI51_9GAMM|nr:DUF1972 domain-containing protein [Photobacterium arenosum]
MKKIAVIGTVGIPACYGGFESLVENLTKYSSEEFLYQVFCADESYEDKLESYNKAELTYLPLSANGISSIPYDILSLIKCIRSKPDVVLILGVSGCIFLPIYKLFSSAKVITNIDGLEWRRDKWGEFARKFLKLSERIAVKYSDVIVTDNQAISDYVLQEYNVKTETIAYGGDHVLTKSVKKIPSNYFLALCRIEPENNVKMILEAFKGTDHKIKFIGNWDKSSFGQEVRRCYEHEPNIELLDPVYDLDVLYEHRNNCRGYIHGHSAGGTNPSLVEVMHFEVPVFAFDCDFNRYSTDNSAQYFGSESDLEALLDNYSLREANKNASNMKKIAKSKYIWSVIAKKYEDLY